MSAILQDIRYATRGLAARPAFTLAALLTIALGVGASVSIFSVVNGVLLQPLPYPAADELTLVWEVDERATPIERRNYVSVANYGDWRNQNRVFESMAAFAIWDVYLRAGTETERVMAGLVAPGFLDTLGVEPVIGRRFIASEAEPENPDVAVIGYELWQRRFGGDPAAVGQAVTVNSQPRTIVGVLPPGFDFMSQDVQLLIPIELSPADFENRRTHRLQVLARLQSSVTVERAQAEMSALADRIRADHPEWMTGWDVNVAPLFGEVVGSVRPTLLVLLGAVGFVLVIATFNVASLLFGRATERQREMAVRAALGAGRAHLIRQLTESLLLALVGGGAGLLWAMAGTEVILALVPGDLPRVDEVAIDARVLLVGVGMSMLVGLACGVIPALQASRTDLQGALKDGGRTGSGGRGSRRLRWMLVVSELAFSVVLLMGAGLMIRTVGRLLDVDPGYRPDNVLTTTISLPPTRYEGVAKVVPFFEQLMDDVRALPGVQSVGVTRFLPFSEEWTFSFVIDGQPLPREGEKRDYGLHPVSADYLETMGMAVLRGRSFTERDYGDAPTVVMINEAMVQRFWAGDDPIGQRIKFGGDPGADRPWFEIVGIARNVRHQGLDMDARPVVYRPYGQRDAPLQGNQMSLAIRTATPPAELVPALRAMLRELDAGLILIETRTMSEAIAESMAHRHFAMILLGVFSIAALVLASIGIYGVVAYTVGQRTQEMGIRMALGASHREILGLIVGQGMAPVAVGLGLGLAAALVVTRFMRSLLYGVATTDPLTLIGVGVVLAAVALIACYVPARRAASVAVLTSLRAE